MNKQELEELREIFRAKFKEEDFCIGEEQVEKVFRELLEEPEPIVEHRVSENSLSANQIGDIFKEVVGVETIKSMFEADDTFYKNLKK